MKKKKQRIEYLRDETENIWGYDNAYLEIDKAGRIWETDFAGGEPERFRQAWVLGDLNALAYDVSNTAYVANHDEGFVYIVHRAQ